ncbi:hypothetical protein [Azospirillum sp. ST 5-10]|uniref:hypothetical protein n=1 Tax=unclassified Azospirillum TaxID=2630922 RepID=UPI003F4A112E
MTPTPRTRPADTVRLDPVEVVERFAAALNGHADRAARAVAEGRARDALLAAGAMQMLLKAQADMLREALGAARSKRVPPAVRAAVRAAADGAADGALAPAQRALATLRTGARVARTRQAAIGDALRATAAARASRPGPVGYNAAGGHGTALRQSVRITV